MRPAASVLVLLLTAISCGAPRSPGERREPGAPPTRVYVPPSDGRLTEGQVSKYVAYLQNRARISAEAGDSEGDSRDAEAARSLGLGLDEIRWVGQKLLDARIRIEEREAQKRNVETYRATLAALEKSLAASSDPATRSTISRQIAELGRELSELERSLRRPTEKTLASNEALALRYRVELDSARGILPVSP